MGINCSRKWIGLFSQVEHWRDGPGTPRCDDSFTRSNSLGSDVPLSPQARRLSVGKKRSPRYRSNVPTLLSLCVGDVARRIDQIDPSVFAKLPRDMIQQVFDELVRRHPMRDSLMPLVKDQGIDHAYLATQRGVNDEWLEILCTDALRVLRVSHCKGLTDQGMACLAEAPNMRRLSLDFCFRVTERGVRGLSQLTALTELSLEGCDCLQDVSFVSEMKGLKKLSLSMCSDLSVGFEHLGNLQSLEVLLLGWCIALGGGPAEAKGGGPMRHIAKLKRLRELDVTRCGLGDRAVTHLQALPNLEVLSLAGCPITDASVASLLALQGLRHLSLEWCVLSGAAMSKLGRMRGLESLNLGYTGVSDACLLKFRHLQNLRMLNLDSCKITNEGMSVFAHLGSLVSLNLSDTAVGNAGLQHLSSAREIQELSLSYTGVTDVGLDSCKSLKALKTLSLDTRQVTDAGLEKLSCLVNLTTLDLFGANITDLGLKHLQNFTRLQALEICSGGITDYGVVCYISKIKTLVSLSLAHNASITDKSLSYIAQLSNLESLNLTSSQITSAGLRRLRPLKRLCSISLLDCKLSKQALEDLARDMPRLQSIGASH